MIKQWQIQFYNESHAWKYIYIVPMHKKETRKSKNAMKLIIN